MPNIVPFFRVLTMAHVLSVEVDSRLSQASVGANPTTLQGHPHEESRNMREFRRRRRRRRVFVQVASTGNQEGSKSGSHTPNLVYKYNLKLPLTGLFVYLL